MKKRLSYLLAFILSLMSSIGSFGQTISQQENRSFLIGKAEDTGISLNGIDSSTARKMILAYQEHRKNDIGPIQNTVWFDSETLKCIYNLLASERMAEHPKAPDSIGYTDGFRIYFAGDTNINTRHLKTSIIIVSTKIAGADTVPSKHVHLDYFYHDKTDILFSTPKPSLNGMVKRRQWINTRGENLYNIWFDQDDNTVCGDPHYISRGKAYKMVNQFGKDSAKRRDTMVTKSEWFDFNLLRSFVLDTHPHTGLRIYFARHPGTYLGTVDKDMYKDAFILIPTYKVHFLFWLYNNDYFDCRSTYNYFLQMQSKLNSWYNTHAMSDGGDDNGEICPNHCPGTTPAP